MDDLISRQALMKEFANFVRDSNNSDFAQTPTWNDAVSLVGSMPIARIERLTDDDFETIRIHLSAIKEKLCNQHRWKEAEEYQHIIDRFMTFASAQPEITEAQVKEYCEKRCLVVLSSDAFHRLKSAQPEQKKGRWIGKPIAGYCTVRCSVCKNVFSENNGRWNFCPTCGADNRGETNDD